MQSDIIKQLKALQSIEPDKAWQTAERGKLMERASAFVVDDIFTVREIQEEKPAFSLRNLFPSRLAVTMTSLALIITSGLMTVNASQSSLPGEKLYAVKKAGEKVALAVASEEDKPKIEIQQAGKRLEELAEVSKNAGDKDKAEALVAEFQEKIDSANTHLEQLSAKGKTDTSVKVADVAKIVNEQSEKYTQVLQATAQAMPEEMKGQMAVQVADASVATQQTNLRALLVMVESPEETPISQEEMAAKVQTAVDQTQAKIDVIALQTTTSSTDCTEPVAEEPPVAQEPVEATETEGVCPLGTSAEDTAKTEEAQKEMDKAKENLKNNNLADTLKSVVAATQIASEVSAATVAESVQTPAASTENAEGQAIDTASETQAVN